MATKHLVILVHGLGGNPSHWDCIVRELRHNPHLDCVAVGYVDGHGVIQSVGQILRRIKQILAVSPEVNQISLVGFSFGGCVIYGVARELYMEGIFQDIRPNCLITIATPHFGVRESYRILLRILPTCHCFGHTIDELLLQDKSLTIPYLLLDPLTQGAISQFHHRINIFNGKRDFSVPKYSSWMNRSIQMETLTHTAPSTPNIPLWNEEHLKRYVLEDKGFFREKSMEKKMYTCMYQHISDQLHAASWTHIKLLPQWYEFNSHMYIIERAQAYILSFLTHDEPSNII